MEQFHITDAASWGDIVTKLLTGAGHSTRHAAEVIGVSPSSLVQWKNGKRLPMAETVGLILRFYGATATIGAAPDDEETP